MAGRAVTTYRSTVAQHTHDGIDWAARVTAAKRTAELEAEALRVVARRLVGPLPDGPTVLDVGCGAGAMSVPLAEALAARGGGTLVLVDAVPELLDVATKAARAAGNVAVKAVLADMAAEDPLGFAGPVDLAWGSRVIHHLPDQQKALKGWSRPWRRAAGWRWSRAGWRRGSCRGISGSANLACRSGWLPRGPSGSA